uniref:Cns1/TTC4 wheel domain-containing protein n=1 Tax=Compsopogon caeruleus TaxID=31354 RepID=A0A7S1XEY2_9RHOD|mmetsp:Transcript_6799/g.13889  ORF Transcript_6799/g.13889 Transcript_6799/m.13889 type:complete len:325 (+) Transcript_6799:668-1642(+)
MEETTDEWWECPLFAPPGSVIPRLEGVSAEEQRVPSALAALSHVLYDEETPQERAELIREHGNRFFRHGPRFQKEAVRLYTEAIGVGCDVPEVIAANYNNRAAAHLKLCNYGYALQDVRKCLDAEPHNVKAMLRGAVAANSLHRFSEAVELCEQALRFLPPPGVANLLQKEKKRAETALHKEAAKDQARQARDEEKLEENLRVRRALQARGVQLGAPLYSQQLRTDPNTVQFGEDGRLIWPVLFVYPDLPSQGLDDQSNHCDLVCEFHEDDTFDDHLEVSCSSLSLGLEVHILIAHWVRRSCSPTLAHPYLGTNISSIEQRISR